MWKKWTLSAIAYLLIVMLGYGIYVSIVGSGSTPSYQEEMNVKGH